tara:strand:+ start:3313 stop:4245 length:933 start_codon:yes stop_codon:yes gene_type:complete
VHQLDKTKNNLIYLNNMRIVELIIDESEELSGVEAVSIVEFPAIESNFISLNKQLELAKVDDEKRILMGAALIPNKNIYRRNGEDEYYIFFSNDTVRKASELFLMNSNQNNATLEHDKKLKDLSVVESWIVEDTEMDKSKKYGLNAPVGTWMVTMKVNNDAIWNDFVKTGKVKGFSIEGYFADKLEMSLKINKKEMEKNVMIENIKSLIEKSELKNQKVELSTIYDDLKGALAEANKEVIKALDLKSQAAKLTQVSINKNRELLKELNKAEGLIKDLGLDSELKKVQKAKSEVSGNLNTLDKILNNLLSV